MTKTAAAQQDGYLKYLEEKVAAARDDIAAGRVRDAEDVEREFAERRARARAQAAENDTSA
ncbi:MAG: hypothetical protein ACYYKD_08500 [Rhodospirillales bacterium]